MYSRLSNLKTSCSFAQAGGVIRTPWNGTIERTGNGALVCQHCITANDYMHTKMAHSSKG